MLRTNTKPRQLIKHAKISYTIVSLLFLKFSYRTYLNGLNQVPQRWGTPSIPKSANRVSSIPLVGNLHFSILLHRVWYLKILLMSQRTGHHFSGRVGNLKLRAHVHKSINSLSLLFTKDMMIFGKQKFDVKQLEDEQFYG